jgi:hypothetical protein
MKASRLVLRTVVALACIALTPWFSAAQDTLYWDWCVKIGDYYDADGTGYHVIYCQGEYTGSASTTSDMVRPSPSSRADPAPRAGRFCASPSII